MTEPDHTQGGEERAEYGKQVVESLSVRLTERYGKLRIEIQKERRQIEAALKEENPD